MRKNMLLLMAVLAIGSSIIFGDLYVDLKEKQYLDYKYQQIEKIINKSDEMWVITGDKKESIRLLDLSINNLILLAVQDKSKLTNEQYNMLLSEIERLRAVKNLREVQMEYDY